jgi:hypothetical protein
VRGAWRPAALLALPVLVAFIATTSSCASALAAPRLLLGFTDGAFLGPSAGAWIQRAASAGSDVVRIDIGWVAPNTRAEPSGFDPRNPADPHYQFAAADRAVRLAARARMRVILDFTGAPRWAEGPHMPTGASPGSWRPNPRAIEQYAVALARRYSGRFPDPTSPSSRLPKVWAFQLWNEPNLPLYLTPQWVGNRVASPSIYRAMLNAFYAGIKSVNPAALVVTAGTGPFGDPWVGGRIMPAMFWRALLCLRQVGARLVGTHCHDPAHFDVLAHHPYSVGAPATKALNFDDVSIPDLGKLTALLRIAESTGGALPRIRHPIWVTEVGYNTNPPNPLGVPVGEDARWVAQTLALLWRQGVSLITWNTIVDQPPIPSYATTSQSGVFFLSGAPKPALEAFRFPLAAWRAGGGVEVWARAPAAGLLRIERLQDGRWRAVLAAPVASHAIVLEHLVQRGPITLRAALAGGTSPPFSLS